jgi:CRISPR-associated protein Cas6/Cse3/CasE subtype I-E
MDFTIRLNPSVAKKKGALNARGQRKAVPVKNLKQWIDSKFMKCGFIADYSIEYENLRESLKKGDVISIASALVTGSLEVLNPETFKKALTGGIGRGKGLGFGMLHIYESLMV